jgi:hypothetical protein
MLTRVIVINTIFVLLIDVTHLDAGVFVIYAEIAAFVFYGALGIYYMWKNKTGCFAKKEEASRDTQEVKPA